MKPSFNIRMGALVLLPYFCLCSYQSPDAQYPRVNIEPRSAPFRAAPTTTTSNLPRIQVYSDLVLIPVSVTDGLDRFVTGLTKDNFKVFEDRVEQTVTHFSSSDVPVSAYFVFDSSGSIGQKMEQSREAVVQILRMANSDDQFGLILVRDQPQIVLSPTNATEEIQNKLLFTPSEGSTALLDSIFVGVLELKKLRGPRKALIIMSDGGDNNSRYELRDVTRLLREADAQIFVIGVFEPEAIRARFKEEALGPQLLEEFSEQTGGRMFVAESVDELPGIAATIGVALRNQYVLGYTPRDAKRDGLYHKVQVKVTPSHGRPELRVHSRQGYYAPDR